MALTVITSDQVSQNTVFNLAANLVMGNVTMTSVGITTGNSTVNTIAVAVGNVVANTTVLAVGNVVANTTALRVTGANTMTINSTAIIFSDSSVQTTAPTAGVDSGTALAYAIALG